MGIVVIGAVFVDIKGYPLATYIPGGRNAGRVEQVHGGVCRNVAEDIANVELRPTFVSLVDDTGTGQDVIDKLARHKVNTRYIQRVPDGMGTWLAVFNNEGDVVAAISKRPDTNPLTDLLAEKGDEIFKDCDGIAIELDLEKDTVKQVLYFAQKYHKKVYAAVSNMSIAMERRDFLQQIDCFVCNQQEAGILFSDEYDHMGPEELSQIAVEDRYFQDDHIFEVLGVPVVVTGDVLAEILAQLPEGKRDIILLSFFLEMTDREIAEYLHIVHQTVSKRRIGILKELRKILEKEGYEWSEL